MRHLVSIADLTTDEVWQILNLATDLKQEWKGGGNTPLLPRKSLGMIFQKPSLPTRVSFEMAMLHLGGQAVYLSPQEIQLGERESVPDIARVLSRYVDAIMARVFAHSDVQGLASHASVPVINGLSDYLHRCQALSDLFTIYEKRGVLQGLKLACVGDGNNVAHSLLFAASKAGMEIRLATPSEYEPRPEVVSEARAFSQETGGRVTLDTDPRSVVGGADIIYTDVWTSVGQEAERGRRLPVFPALSGEH